MLRSRAVAHAAVRSDETTMRYVRSMWARPLRPWLRAEILRVLDRYGEELHVGECPDLVFHEDHDLASAAIDCLAGSGIEDAAGILARRAVDGDACLRLRALQLLERMLRHGSRVHAGVVEILDPALDHEEVPGMLARLLVVADLAGSDRTVAFAKKLMRRDAPAMAGSVVARPRTRRPEREGP
jgi:hypothetical protein